MIRPIDLQNTILQSIQSASAVQRGEDGPRQAAQAAQAAFAADVTHRDETVAATSEVLGNRVGAKPEGERKGDTSRQRKGKSAPGGFEEVIDEAAGFGDDPVHLIDVTA